MSARPEDNLKNARKLVAKLCFEKKRVKGGGVARELAFYVIYGSIISAVFYRKRSLWQRRGASVLREPMAALVAC